MSISPDIFADLEYKPSALTASKKTSNLFTVISRNANANASAIHPANKASHLKAENYDLWFQNERLAEEYAQIASEHAQLQAKHDQLLRVSTIS